MDQKKKNSFHFFLNFRIQVFVQFVFIFLVIISIILFSSSSFYESMIESVNMFKMRETISKIDSIDLYTDNSLSEIKKLESEHDVFIEIYSRNEQTREYTTTVYARYNYAVLTDNENHMILPDEPEPIVNYIKSQFELIRELDDNSLAGISANTTTAEKYFVLVSHSDDSNYRFVCATNYATIESQAQVISFSAFIITVIIFICVSIAIYFYITQITRPLNDIIQVTKIMAEEKNKSIRIPTRNNVIKTDTDDAIFHINMLYESLMLTQERLLEKSEVLAVQLEEKEIEQKTRAEFIADTSHELKTPISIIQGYAEGIRYVLDDRKAAEEYCDTIIEECARMTDLVVNMMSLSNIQHSDNLNVSNFSLNDFLDERLKLHQKVFEKNGITASNLIKDKIFGFADTAKLQFVINNLLSNAISYIGGEDKRIDIRYEELELCYRIYVYNTGEHISPDALQKLWDSFYRQDAARLRSEGHFGLGLSIVKAVQDAHSQQCGVENTDGGVQFWFDVSKGEEIKEED